MKRKGILSFGILLCILIITSCEVGKDECVQNFMDEGLTENEAVKKCDEELMETVEVVR